MIVTTTTPAATSDYNNSPETNDQDIGDYDASSPEPKRKRSSSSKDVGQIPHQLRNGTPMSDYFFSGTRIRTFTVSGGPVGRAKSRKGCRRKTGPVAKGEGKNHTSFIITAVNFNVCLIFSLVHGITVVVKLPKVLINCLFLTGNLFNIYKQDYNINYGMCKYLQLFITVTIILFINYWPNV